MIAPPSVRRLNGSSAEQWFGQFWKLLVRLALIAFLAYFLWRVRSILTDILVAAVLAFALVGPVDRLCRVPVRGLKRRTQRLLATILVFVLFGFVVYQSIALMLTPFERQVLHLSENLPLYQHKVMVYVASLKAWYSHLEPEYQGMIQRLFGGGGSGSGASSDWLRGFLLATFMGLTKIVDVLIVPVLAFYFVLDGHALRNEFLALLPRRRVRETLHFLRESSAIMRTYIIAQLWLCVIAGLVVYLGLSLIHMPYALILGLLAGVTRAIPIIGPIIGGIPIILLALVLPGGVLLALKILVFFSLLHLIESKLIMPKFIGHRIHLHAAVVIIVLLIGGEFFGLLGMFLAAPLAAIARVLIGHYLLRPRRLAARTTVQAPPLLIKTN